MIGDRPVLAFLLSCFLVFWLSCFLVLSCCGELQRSKTVGKDQKNNLSSFLFLYEIGAKIKIISPFRIAGSVCCGSRCPFWFGYDSFISCKENEVEVIKEEKKEEGRRHVMWQGLT